MVQSHYQYPFVHNPRPFAIEGQRYWGNRVGKVFGQFGV